MSALIIGGIAFMCGGAIGAAWFVATLQREKPKRKAKRKEKRIIYRGGTGPEPRKPLPPDLAALMHPGEPTPSDPDPDALLFETEAAPTAEQSSVMGPYVWNTDEYVNGGLYGYGLLSGMPTGFGAYCGISASAHTEDMRFPTEAHKLRNQKLYGYSPESRTHDD